MSTMTMTMPKSFKGMLVLLLMVAGIAGLLLLATLPPLNDHAVKEHDRAALQAWQYINSLEHADHCRWSCSDGRERYVCGMPDGRWAIAVVEAGHLITSFIADQEYAKSTIDKPGCTNPFHYTHP